MAQSRSETYGLTVSARSAGTNTVLVPCAERTWMGIDTPWLMRASVLLRTVILGAETMRTEPVPSRADRRRLML